MKRSILLLVMLPVLASAQPVLTPDYSLSGDHPDGTPSLFGDAYGSAAASWKDWLFVGAPRETVLRDGFEAQDGAVYIYENRDGAYLLRQKLTMPGSSGTSGDRFGGGIASAGGWLFVGASNDQDFPGLVDPRQGISYDSPPFYFAGQVHVYELIYGNWEFAQTLIAPVPGSQGSFGTRTGASNIALKDNGKVAVIGELHNYPAGVGQLHTYRVKDGAWQYVMTIDAPLENLHSFGDDLVFASNRYLVAGGFISPEPWTEGQGVVFVYKSIFNSGYFETSPRQTIAGPVVNFDDCWIAGTQGFGVSGLDASGGTVVVADPCATGVAGPLAGNLSVFRLERGATPLVLEATIEGDLPDMTLGASFTGSRHAVAVSESGSRILAGAPMWPLGYPDYGSIGADVRLYVHDGTGWTNEAWLTTLTPDTAIIRAFGDSVYFTDDETAFAREGNLIDPYETGLKGQGLFYVLPALPGGDDDSSDDDSSDDESSDD